MERCEFALIVLEILSKLQYTGFVLQNHPFKTHELRELEAQY
jgi:hypothetical protein